MEFPLIDSVSVNPLIDPTPTCRVARHPILPQLYGTDATWADEEEEELDPASLSEIEDFAPSEPSRSSSVAVAEHNAQLVCLSIIICLLCIKTNFNCRVLLKSPMRYNLCSTFLPMPYRIKF